MSSNNKVWSHVYLRFTSTSQKNPTETNDIKGSTVIDGLAATSKWKKGQLDKLSDKFKASGSEGDLKSNLSHQRVGVGVTTPDEIDNDDDVQPMWREMESRVLNRKSLTKEQIEKRGKRTGRSNLRRTDEDAWLSAGLYDDKEKEET